MNKAVNFKKKENLVFMQIESTRFCSSSLKKHTHLLLSCGICSNKHSNAYAHFTSFLTNNKEVYHSSQDSILAA